MRGHRFTTKLRVGLARRCRVLVNFLPVSISFRDWLTLIRQDRQTLLEWAWILDTDGWPKLLPNPDDRRREQVWSWITNRIGMVDVIWYQLQLCGWTRERFDTWIQTGVDSYQYDAFTEDFRWGVAEQRVWKKHNAMHPVEYADVQYAETA